MTRGDTPERSSDLLSNIRSFDPFDSNKGTEFRKMFLKQLWKSGNVLGCATIYCQLGTEISKLYDSKRFSEEL